VGLGLVIVYGLAWFAAYNVALNAGEVRIDAGTAALLVNIGPLLIAFAGVALIAFGDDGGSDADLIGTGLCVLAALLYAVGVLVQKRVLRTMPALTVTWYGCLIGTIVCLPFAPALIGAELGTTSATTYLVPPTAILISWALLSETPTLVALMGGGLCLLGVAITRVRSKVPTPDPGAGRTRSA